VSLALGAATLARYAAVALPDRPLLVPWIRPVDMGDGLIELRADATFYPLRHELLGAAFRAVSDRLDGARTVDAIVAELPEGVAPATVVFLLKTLRAVGLLLDAAELDGEDTDRRDRMLFLSHFTAEPANVARRLAAATVRIAGPEPLAARLADRVRAAGCGDVALTQPEGEVADLVLACSDAPAHGLFAAINARALETGTPWLRIACHGATAWLGPLVVPGETACLTCLEAREQANARGSGVPIDLESGTIGAFTPLHDLLIAHGTAEAARFLGGFAAAGTLGSMYELTAASPEARRHVVLRDPTCSACGALWAGPGAPAE
jgi:bacteriocin biosynthesis cyclodehydratase domain-containing protein